MSDIIFPAQLTADEARKLKRALSGLGPALALAEEEAGDFIAAADHLPKLALRQEQALNTELFEEEDDSLFDGQVEAADDARAFLAARIATVRAEFVAGLAEAAAGEIPTGEAA
ncbi:hypothetical protein V5F77_20310 [Xanthobacter sp. DSM 24535]|uniref:hypothetical protein n=1 Tax=Roseixanthobacter psychrophilus TaxID=3119917 RepID=UPI00372805FF